MNESFALKLRPTGHAIAVPFAGVGGVFRNRCQLQRLVVNPYHALSP
jgi:hypothetical protein